MDWWSRIERDVPHGSRAEKPGSPARAPALGPVPRSGFSGLFLEKPVLIFVVGQRGSCGLKE